MHVLSFDIGTKNLAFCLLRVYPHVQNGDNDCIPKAYQHKLSFSGSFDQMFSRKIDICKWGSTCLVPLQEKANAGNMEKIVEKVPGVLRDIGGDSLDYVVIERQVGSNVKMMCLSYAIQMYYILQHPQTKVVFMTPSSKFSWSKYIPGDFLLTESLLSLDPIIAQLPKSIKPQKKRSITHCLYLLRDSGWMEEGGEEWLQYFTQTKKKDDIADALIQAVSLVVTIGDDDYLYGVGCDHGPNHD